MLQDVTFFDKKENSAGLLLSIVSSSIEDLIGLGDPVMGGTLTFISVILGGIILSLAIGWKLALVCPTTIPLIVACGWLRIQILAVFDAKTRQNGRESASYASELIKSVETVASLSLEEFVLERYDDFLVQQSEGSLRSILCAALGFWYGGTLIADGEYSSFQFFICFSALISGSQIAGSIFTFAPDAGKAMHAGWEVKQILERRPLISDNDVAGGPGGGDLSEQKIENGTIEFKGVTFNYPSRPQQLALDNFNLKVEPGQSIALVGGSGSGKSTVFALIGRFYDPNRGSVHVGGHDIAKLNLGRYREIISLVSQEPVLYSGSMRENIALGAPGQDVSDEAIWEACRQANIHDFIASLQEGLSTMTGPSGNMLSGGQRQRISIARALLRRPKILLLDEATSALDTESERLVQAALDAAAKDKTTLTIAHRLSTVRQADRIYVLSQGSVVESGTHEELLAKRGKYWEFVNMQSLQ